MLRNFLLLLLLTGFTGSFLSAQTTDDQARDDLDYYNNSQPASSSGGDLTSRLWWGTGGTLGFRGGNGQSIFQVGLSPMVGYKVNNFLSFGPRGSVIYNAFRFEDFSGNVDKYNFVTWQAGVFTRAQIFGQFFVHGEYSLVNQAIAFDSPSRGDVLRTTRAIPFLGGGINQGGGPGQVGFEFMVLFRLSQRDQINDLPFEVRSGINFNF